MCVIYVFIDGIVSYIEVPYINIFLSYLIIYQVFIELKAIESSDLSYASISELAVLFLLKLYLSSYLTLCTVVDVLR